MVEETTNMALEEGMTRVQDSGELAAEKQAVEETEAAKFGSWVQHWSLAQQGSLAQNKGSPGSYAGRAPRPQSLQIYSC